MGCVVSKVFDKFTDKFPGAAAAGEHYGTDAFKITYVEEWRSELEAHFGVFGAPDCGVEEPPRSDAGQRRLAGGLDASG